MQESRESAQCPSCGRFIGAYTTCPYCGAHLKQRLSVKLLKVFALSFSVLGVILLLLIARHKEIPVIPIGHISTTMNYGFIRISGIVTEMPRVDLDKKSVSIEIQDLTGTLNVRAYGAVVDDLAASQKIPRVGDTLDVAGTIRIRAQKPSLLINLPELVKITSPKPLLLDIVQLNPEFLYKVVTVQGELTEFRDYDALLKFTLSDSSNRTEIEVVLYKDAHSEALPELARGDMIRLTGLLSEYRDKLQLYPRSMSDIEFIEKVETGERTRISPPPQSILIKDLNPNLIGKLVVVYGEITFRRDFSGGAEFTLKADDHYTKVVIWSSILNQVPGNLNLRIGQRIQVTGKVDEYRDKIQIVPRKPEDIIFSD
ncbi:hypothetical protein JW877_05040 [bacterium]|nr:hypothetical protein [bacterium]